jgi:membrane fusion protein, copper/silver efflux system
MKTTMITLSILFGSLTLNSQAYTQHNHSHSHQSQHQHESKSGSYATDDFRSEFAELMQAYFELKESLVHSDLELAGHGAHSMAERLDDIGPHRLEGDEHMFWMNRFEDLGGAVAAVHDADNLDDTREYFHAVSDLLIEIVETLGIDGIVYHQYCPMAGAGWLSASEEIRNPYMPETMLGCGRIEHRFGE